ncbi:MAG TPA: nucleotide exchange factor GrpE [Candidatus Nanopelagicales bacterium]|nr:nucleotide exchange factor GrpE [Candidatus Nanopelagicales bacterium]
MTEQPNEPTEGSGGFSFQDKRRIDPETGEVREQPAAAPGPAPADDFDSIVEGIEVDLGVVDTKVAELTADLQRVHAEYANYRKRVERDREATKDLAVGAALGDMLPVLDDIGRARDHGDLEGAFKSVAESFESTVARLGLEKYGADGDPFDPTIHEAISHATSPDVQGPTCTQVFQPGYRYKGRVLRPAIVAVTDPE